MDLNSENMVETFLNESNALYQKYLGIILVHNQYYIDHPLSVSLWSSILSANGWYKSNRL